MLNLRYISLCLLLPMWVGFACSPTNAPNSSTKVTKKSNLESISSFEEMSKTHLPLEVLGNNTMDAKAGDVDNDGDLDLVLAIEWKPNLVLLNDGKGNFKNYITLSEKNHDSEDVALEDFDGDGDLDIVIVTEDDFINEYYLNDGKGNFTDNSENFPVKYKTNGVTAADLDSDGAIDLALANDGQNVILWNDGKGNFKEGKNNLPENTETTQDIEIGDINSDGKLDLLFGNEERNRILLNQGKRVFVDVSTDNLPERPEGLEETREADLGDIDGDGDLDIFFANVKFFKGDNPYNRLLVNDGNGKFSETSEAQFPHNIVTHTVDADFADIDGDGDLDLISGGPFIIYQNDGKGNFKPMNFELPEIRPFLVDLEVLDLNGDGKVDIFCGNFRRGDILLFGR